jgi:sulfite exporter TauE/SafE
MCGPFAASGPALPWHAGRLATYAALGALGGGIGAALGGPAWLAPALAVALLAWSALRFAGLMPELGGGPFRGLARAGAVLAGVGGTPGRLGLGAVSALLPCGLVYGALALPIASRSAAYGALAMLAFGAGTLPALSVARAALRRVASLGRWARRGVAALVLAAGLAAIASRATHANDPGEPTCHRP